MATTAAIQAESPRVIVKYVLREAGVPDTDVEARHANIDEARNFAMNLVRDGKAHPESIILYERTGFQVMLSCDSFPQPADPSAALRR